MTKTETINELASELAQKRADVRIAKRRVVDAERELASTNRAFVAIKSRLSGTEADLDRVKREKEYLSSELEQRDEEIERMRREVMSIVQLDRLNFDGGAIGPELHDQIAKALGVPQ